MRSLTNEQKKSKHEVWILSGRPGSNRPPRPWQGRALPNELLPRYYKELFYKELIFKNR